MRWFRAMCVVALAQGGLTGCSTHPIPDDVTRVSTYGIVQQIRCEAGRAIRELALNYTTAAIAYEFNFDIIENTTVTDAQAVFTKLFSTSFFTLTLTSPFDQKSRQGVRNFRIVDSFTDAKNTDCPNDPLRKNLLYPISGDIGAYEVLATFVKLQRAHPLGDIGVPPAPGQGGLLGSQKPPTGEVFVFADRLTFTTTLTAGAKPRLVLNPRRGELRATNAKADLATSRVDIHQVTIAVAAGPQPIPAASARALLRSGPGYTPQTTSSLLSTTIIQAQATAEQKALFELDRQRILALQEQVPNLLVGQ
jgi:hypothetical protein